MTLLLNPNKILHRSLHVAFALEIDTAEYLMQKQRN